MLRVLFYWPQGHEANLFCSSWRNFRDSRAPVDTSPVTEGVTLFKHRVLLFLRNFIQSEVSIQATYNKSIWFVARQVWTWVVKCRTLLATRFCCPFYRSLKVSRFRFLVLFSFWWMDRRTRCFSSRESGRDKHAGLVLFNCGAQYFFSRLSEWDNSASL